LHRSFREDDRGAIAPRLRYFIYIESKLVDACNDWAANAFVNSIRSICSSESSARSNAFRDDVSVQPISSGSTPADADETNLALGSNPSSLHLSADARSIAQAPSLIPMHCPL